MKTSKSLMTAALVALAISGAQAQFTLSGEIRPRTEVSHGYKSLAAPDQDYSTFTGQRTRLNAFYKDSLVTSKIVLQDVRTWGNQAQLVANEANSASIHEAWAEVELIKDLSLKAGRQEVIYDDHRIFGSVGWAHQARSHDLAKLKYENDSIKLKIHVGGAVHQNTNRTNAAYGGPDAYKSLQFLWVNKKLGDLSLSLLALNNGKPEVKETALDKDGNTIVTKESIKYSQTVGGRAVYKTGGLTGALAGYYQMGDDGKGKDLNAYYAAAEVGYKITKALSVKAGYELLSGTAYDEAEANNSFTPFYGTNHKFNGHMDYFYVGNHVNSVGLNDIYVGAKYKLGKKGFITATAHSFSAAAEIGEDVDKALGTEVDAAVGYKFSKIASIKAGYSQMFGTETLEAIRGGDKGETSNWGWVMLIVKPTFIKNK